MQGRVIYPKIAVPDPQGQNPKEGRPFVVVTTNDNLKKGGPLCAVGITSFIDPSCADDYVSLPYGPTARSGLRKESAALCTWVIEIMADQVEVGPGYIHPGLVLQIAERIESMKTVAQVIREPECWFVIEKQKPSYEKSCPEFRQKGINLIDGKW